MSTGKDLEDGNSGEPNITTMDSSDDSVNRDDGEDTPVKETFGQRLLRNLKTPGSALQIVIAAVIAIAIGMAVTATVSDIPEAAPVILEIPGQLWLRALRATVLPLIITAIILAVQNLKEMSKGGAKLAKFTVGLGSLFKRCKILIFCAGALVRHHDNHRRRPQHDSGRPCLETPDAAGRPIHSPRGTGRGGRSAGREPRQCASRYCGLGRGGELPLVVPTPQIC
jgi:hypothetical protein